MKKLLLYLSLSLILFNTTNAEEVTTGNLLDQNFDNGSWSGTADGRHGSSVIAAHNDEHITSDDVSLRNDANLTQEQINDGFTTNHSFRYWHWNDFNSTVQSTVTVVGSDGETTTQTRTYNSTGCGSINCGSYNTGADSLSISRNNQTDYNINVRYDFSDTSNATGHYGVDLKEPSLTVTYESDPVRLDTNLENEIIELFDDFKPEDNIKFEDTKIEDNFVALPEPSFAIEEEFKMEEEIKLEEPEVKEEANFSEPMVMDVPEEQKEEEPVMEMVMEFIEEDDKKEEEPRPMEVTEMPEEKPEEEKTTSELLQERFKEEQEQNEKEEASEEEPDSNPTESADAEESDNQEQKETVRSKETKTVGLETVLDKIDEKIKDIDKNLQLKNLVKLKVMASNNLLDAYNIPFYEPKIIYEDQIKIQDDRTIYKVDLVEYKQKDPITKKNQRLNSILQERQKLIKELQVLQNG